METRAAFLHASTHTMVFSSTPTHASWMNQIEMWLRILGRTLLTRGTFSSVQDLQDQILAFLTSENLLMAKPFTWTSQGLPADV